MANLNLFGSLTARLRRADAVNEAGGRAYALEPKHALAQLAATGCFHGTFYAEAEDQLSTLLALAADLDFTIRATIDAGDQRQRIGNSRSPNRQ